ncbi:MAG: trypsin-like peptidase domain-containing protein [Planctomycetaceae bacterium]|nr:trypsin-like peptidase domain-containing protein [Planctomycetaceae bacterium]
MPILAPLAFVFLGWADPPEPTPEAGQEVVAALEMVLADAIAKAEPSVVAIAREKSENEETTAIRGRNPVEFAEPIGADEISFDYGSGVVIGDRGEILTAFHLVQGARRIKVRALVRQSFDAEIIAADPRSDLAVLVPRESRGVAPPKLKPIPLGDATKLRKGSFLLALGNPFNAAGRDGRPTASWGILANVARRLEVSANERRQKGLQLSNYPTLLQLDAKLNLGMSGGAVINILGELVGLTTTSANAAGFDALAGYAIPMDAMGRRAVESLRQGKEVEYGLLGILLDPGGSNHVRDAQPNSPAGEGGVQAEDAILAVGETPVQDADGLLLAINALPAGTPVTLRILRRGEVLERRVELAKLRVEGVIATNRAPAWRGLRVDYTSTLPQTTFGDGILSAMAGGGVAVAEVEPDSPAERAGLKRGQVIKSVAGQGVRNPRDFAKAVADRDGPVTFLTDLGPVTVK